MAVGFPKTWPSCLPAEGSKKNHLPPTVWQGAWGFTVLLHLGFSWWMPSGSGAVWGLNMQLKTLDIKVQQLVNFIAQVSMVALISHPGNLMGGRNCFLDRCSQSHGWNAPNYDPRGIGVNVRPEVHYSGSVSLWLTQSQCGIWRRSPQDVTGVRSHFPFFLLSLCDSSSSCLELCSCQPLKNIICSRLPGCSDLLLYMTLQRCYSSPTPCQEFYLNPLLQSQYVNSHLQWRTRISGKLQWSNGSF